MGLCFSSCRRRRRRSKDSSGRGHQYSESEESPLLGDSIDDSGSQSTVTNAVNLANKAVEVVASLKSGKYPSQDQVDNLLRRFLQSDILRESRYTQISPQGQHIIHDVHRLCGVLLVFGAEKNGDDRLQDLLFLANTISKPVDYAVGGGETKIELDVHCKVPRSQDLGHDLNQFIEAVKSLTVLLFSSTTARIIVSNIVVFVRDIVANFADDISDAAQQVQGLAEGVGKIAESVEATVEGISNNSEADANTPVHKVAHTPTQIEVAVREVADNANAAAAFVQDAKHRDSSDAPHRHTDDSQSDSAAEGIQAILVEAHQDPRYIAALKTLLSLLEKYLSIWQELGVMLSQPSPPVFKFNSIAADTKILLERLASGKSLDPLLATMSNLVTAVTSVPGEDHTVAQLRDYFTDLRGYLVRAYSDLSYVKSSRCRADISQMIHRGRIILKAAHRTENLLKIFIGEAQTFISALSKDHTTVRLLRAFTTLSTDIHDYLTSARASITTRGSLCHWSEVMWNDIAAVAMNALLSLTRNIFRPNGAVIIPIPRVEYGDTKLDVAVDGQLMKVSLVDDAWNEARYAGVGGDPESDMPNRLTPSSISVRRWSELRLDFAAATLPENGTAITSSNKVNIHIDGVLSGARHKVVSLADLGYFFRFKSFLGYEDEGVLGLNIGFGGLGGGTIDIVLELDTQTADEDQVDFSIASVTVTLPPSLDIGVELMDSRHWVLNAMLTPIALPLIKWFVRRELEKTVEQWIRSAINSLARGLHAVRDETHKDGGQSVWTAIANVISSGQLFNASAVDEPDVRTETTVSLKGVQIQRGAADDGGESQSTMTIGIAPQILPCKGELQPLVSPEAMYEHVASEVSDQVAYAEERLVDAEQQVREGLSAVEELIDRAGDTLKRTESGERRIDGWRSHTFDM